MNHASSDDQVASVLVSHAPRRQAHALLEHLVARLAARGAAILTVGPGPLTVFAAVDVEAPRLTTLLERWSSIRENLALGRPHVEDASVLYPLLDGGALVAVLYLEGLPYADLTAVSAYTLPMAKAVLLASPVEATVRTAAPEGRPSDPLRHLLDALERSEWNVASVARMLGTTRRTIYMRLQRYGIERKKVPKMLGPRRKRTPPLEPKPAG